MDTQPTPTTLADVQLAILRQHTQLGQLIDELEANADAVLAGRGDGKALNDALALVHMRFVRHLEYEDAHLAKCLPPTESGEPVLGDHSDQRSRLSGLLHDRDVFGDPRTFAREVLTFVHQVRKDIAEENAKVRALR